MFRKKVQKLIKMAIKSRSKCEKRRKKLNFSIVAYCLNTNVLFCAIINSIWSFIKFLVSWSFFWKTFSTNTTYNNNNNNKSNNNKCVRVIREELKWLYRWPRHKKRAKQPPTPFPPHLNLYLKYLSNSTQLHNGQRRKSP